VAFTASPLDPRVHALLADAGFGALFHPRQHWCCELVDHYVLCLAVELVRGLELDRPASVDEVLAARGWSAAFRIPLGWLLARLAAAGLAACDADGCWTLGALPAVDLAGLRAEALAADASYARSMPSSTRRRRSTPRSHAARAAMPPSSERPPCGSPTSAMRTRTTRSTIALRPRPRPA
jgi:hypothetical protein